MQKILSNRSVWLYLFVVGVFLAIHPGIENGLLKNHVRDYNLNQIAHLAGLLAILFAPMLQVMLGDILSKDKKRISWALLWSPMVFVLMMVPLLHMMEGNLIHQDIAQFMMITFAFLSLTLYVIAIFWIKDPLGNTEEPT